MTPQPWGKDGLREHACVLTKSYKQPSHQGESRSLYFAVVASHAHCHFTRVDLPLSPFLFHRGGSRAVWDEVTGPRPPS